MISKTQRNALDEFAEKFFGECKHCDFLHFNFSTFGDMEFQPRHLPTEWQLLHQSLKYGEKTDIFYPPNAEEEIKKQYDDLQITNEQAVEFLEKWTHPSARNINQNTSAKNCNIDTDSKFEKDLQSALEASLAEQDDMQKVLLESLKGQATQFYDDEGAGAPPQRVLDMQAQQSSWQIPSHKQLMAMGLTPEEYAALGDLH